SRPGPRRLGSGYGRRAWCRHARDNRVILCRSCLGRSIRGSPMNISAMSIKNRSSLLCSLIPTLLAVSVSAVLAPQEGRAQSAEQSLWSDPATWPNGKVPVEGDKVVIARDKNVLLDVSPPALGGLSIDGKLTFSSDADLELTTEWIMTHGQLSIRRDARTHTRTADITL